MSTATQTAIAWSSGKDSAWAYYKTHEQYGISAVLTTLTRPYERISMHGVREQLLDCQAHMLNLPCHKVWLPKAGSSNDMYEQVMKETLRRLRDSGITQLIFGDLFLEDIREYRERQMKEVGMQAIFPLWQRNTSELGNSMIEAGLKAIVTCIDSRKLDTSFAGRQYDRQFIADLPSGVDPCGENGEFHSFVYDGPFFREAIKVKTGETVERGDFIFTDVLLARS